MKRVLTAYILGLLTYVLLLAGDGTLNTLPAERRMLLAIMAFLCFRAVQSTFGAAPEQVISKPRYRNWQAAILPFAFMTPPFVLAWLAWFSTRYVLPHNIPKTTIALSMIMVLLVINLLFVLLVQPRGKFAAADKDQPRHGAGKFLFDILFYGAFGLGFGLGLMGLIVLSPDSLDDIDAIGQHTITMYVLIVVVQWVWRFFASVLRPTQKADEVTEY